MNGLATARTFRATGRPVLVWDVDTARAHAAAALVGAEVAASRGAALAADLVATVTPGREILLGEGSLRPGQHVSLMGADGPGKAEIAVGELARVRLFCDSWEQASHGGELAAAVEAGVVTRADVAELGAVLAGDAEGRRSDDEATAFDSTGLAIQDLAIALAALERVGRARRPAADPGVATSPAACAGAARSGRGSPSAPRRSSPTSRPGPSPARPGRCPLRPPFTQAAQSSKPAAGSGSGTSPGTRMNAAQTLRGLVFT